jgi:hypothetical protein
MDQNTSTGVDPLFQPDKGAYAVADFRYAGKEYLIGEPFPVKDLPQLEIWTMWRGGRIEFGEPNPLALADAKARREEIEAEAKLRAKLAERAAKAGKTPATAAS